ncbi:MAG: CYTH domain-containing protein [Clostridia bacterium]|jgi:CYTH domain-containing protein|nr:CYTH domain-containing protein [Clostridia bacterium]MCI2001207.1 CYTH domain-containing protein [Clostridia bacterium]MCI2015925.1 CYTH domain-containing protein [Clostridia bacterium]
MEIEKKYHTEKIPFEISEYKKSEISQCYISITPTIRIRKLDNTYTLTMKGSGKISHEEFELEITEKQYIHLLSKAETPQVIKTRYYIPIENNLTAEVDIYHGFLEGLITTEVEFRTIEQMNSFNAPLWFGKDVSLDKRFKNTALSIDGIPKT